MVPARDGGVGGTEPRAPFASGCSYRPDLGLSTTNTTADADMDRKLGQLATPPLHIMYLFDDSGNCETFTPKQIKEPGPLGLKVGHKKNGTVCEVLPSEKAKQLELKEGDIICHPLRPNRPLTLQEISYLAASPRRPIHFAVKRVYPPALDIQTGAAASPIASSSSTAPTTPTGPEESAGASGASCGRGNELPSHASMPSLRQVTPRATGCDYTVQAGVEPSHPLSKPGSAQLSLEADSQKGETVGAEAVIPDFEKGASVAAATHHAFLVADEGASDMSSATNSRSQAGAPAASSSISGETRTSREAAVVSPDSATRQNSAPLKEAALGNEAMARRTVADEGVPESPGTVRAGSDSAGSLESSFPKTSAIEVRQTEGAAENKNGRQTGWTPITSSEIENPSASVKRPAQTAAATDSATLMVETDSPMKRPRVELFWRQIVEPRLRPGLETWRRKFSLHRRDRVESRERARASRDKVDQLIALQQQVMAAKAARAGKETMLRGLIRNLSDLAREADVPQLNMEDMIEDPAMNDHESIRDSSDGPESDEDRVSKVSCAKDIDEAVSLWQRSLECLSTICDDLDDGIAKLENIIPQLQKEFEEDRKEQRAADQEMEAVREYAREPLSRPVVL